MWKPDSLRNLMQVWLRMSQRKFTNHIYSSLKPMVRHRHRQPTRQICSIQKMGVALALQAQVRADRHGPVPARTRQVYHRTVKRKRQVYLRTVNLCNLAILTVRNLSVNEIDTIFSYSLALSR